MIKNEIVNYLARNRIVEGIVKNLGTNEQEFDLDDLVQDVYLSILEKDDEYIEGMYNRNQLKYFIYTIVKNNIFSKNSRYYYLYKRNQILFDDIDTIYEDKEED